MKSQPTLHIPIGIPGCGKTTFFSQFPFSCHSSDDIRQEIYAVEGLDPDVYHPEVNSEVFAQFYRRIKTDLAAGKDVVADATNLESRSRDALYLIGEVEGARKHVWLFTNLTQATKRNRQREGWALVPQTAMEIMLARWEQTRIDLFGPESDRYQSLTCIEAVY